MWCNVMYLLYIYIYIIEIIHGNSTYYPYYMIYGSLGEPIIVRPRPATSHGQAPGRNLPRPARQACRFPMKNNKLKEDVTMKKTWKTHETIWTKHETTIRNYEHHMRQHEKNENNMKKTWTIHETTMNKPWKHVQTWKKQIQHTQRLNTQCFT